MTDKVHMTMDEFIQLVEDNPNRHFEFNAEGEVIEVSPKRLHSWIQARVAHFLNTYILSFALSGYEVLTECAHDLQGWPCRPDVSVDPVGDEEIPTTAPLVAVEIKSNSNSYKDLRAKARKYLEHGAAMVWLVYPSKRFIEVYQANADDQVLFDTDTLEGGDVLPGFTLAVKELFRD